VELGLTIEAFAIANFVHLYVFHLISDTAFHVKGIMVCSCLHAFQTKALVHRRICGSVMDSFDYFVGSFIPFQRRLGFICTLFNIK
jgi:hypothetical protein